MNYKSISLALFFMLCSSLALGANASSNFPKGQDKTKKVVKVEEKTTTQPIASLTKEVDEFSVEFVDSKFKSADPDMNPEVMFQHASSIVTETVVEEVEESSKEVASEEVSTETKSAETSSTAVEKEIAETKPTENTSDSLKEEKVQEFAEVKQEIKTDTTSEVSEKYQIADVIAKQDKNIKEQAQASLEEQDSKVAQLKESANEAIEDNKTDADNNLDNKELAKAESSKAEVKEEVAKTESIEVAATDEKNDLDKAKDKEQIQKESDSKTDSVVADAGDKKAQEPQKEIAQNQAEVKDNPASATQDAAKVEAKELVITDEMLYAKELDAIIPLPKKVDMSLNQGTYVVEKGIGTQRLIRDLYKKDYKEKGITPEMLLTSLFRRNPKYFGDVGPLFPYENGQLVIPTEEQILLEKSSTFTDYLNKEGERLVSSKLPKIDVNAEYDKKLKIQLEKRKEYLSQNLKNK